MNQKHFAVGDRIELQSDGWSALVGTVAAVSENSGSMKGKMIVVELRPAPQPNAQHPQPQQPPPRQTASA